MPGDSVPHRVLKLRAGDGFMVFDRRRGGYTFCLHHDNGRWTLVGGGAPDVGRLERGDWMEMPHGLGKIRWVEHTGAELKMHYHLADEGHTRIEIMRSTKNKKIAKRVDKRVKGVVKYPVTRQMPVVGARR